MREVLFSRFTLSDCLSPPLPLLPRNPLTLTLSPSLSLLSFLFLIVMLWGLCNHNCEHRDEKCDDDNADNAENNAEIMLKRHKY